MPGPFKPFDLMTAEDYAAIGLKCGLEVHQQLLTRRKLFCRCPAGRYNNDYDAEILRHMRPTLSELGEYDGTALMEKKTKKNIFYRIHHDTVCTYEMDDTPPFFMDNEALDIALEIALLLRLNMVSELHVARKQYLDGSIPTGFQRTTIVGVDGWIPFGSRRIGIRQLGLEEDACREVYDVGHDRAYLTDRLGMPLVEVVTEPDMRTPEEASDVGQIIRRLCRSTGHVRTGYGAARQDVNVSITGGTRIEIKGTPQISRNPRLIYNEAMRQWSLLRIREELKQRGVTPDTFSHASADVTRIVAKCDYQPIQAALAAGHRAKCVLLKGFAGLLNEPTQEHTTFAKEFSDRVRVIACLTQLPNMVHSDAASESLSGRHWKEIRRKTRAEHGDALLLVWGGDEDTDTACKEIVIRAKEATVGIPSDTRQALKDGTNAFERVLPGADRMYPDTDLPPLAVEEERLAEVQQRLPAYFWDREEQYKKLSLPDDTIRVLSISRRANLFDRLVRELKISPKFAAVVLVQRFKAWRREGFNPEELADETVFAAFRAFAAGHIAREGVPLILQCALQSDKASVQFVERAIDELDLHPLSPDEIGVRIEQALQTVDSDRFATRDQRFNYVMGTLMRNLRGRANATELAAEVARGMGIAAGEKAGEKITT